MSSSASSVSSVMSSTLPSGGAGAFADHFSAAVSKYRTYRPAYPAELFQYISSLCSAHDVCVDAGTGNGQAAQSISKYFKKVLAFDPAKTMVENAVKDASNVEYFVSRGEDFATQLPLQPESVDLIISATAVHWMNFAEFYANAHRVLKPGGILAVFSYNCFELVSNSAATEVVHHFHNNDLGDFWPKEISYLTDNYKFLPFPAVYVEDFNSHFHVNFPFDVNTNFHIDRQMTFEDTVGFMQSWSGTHKWIEKNGKEKFALITEQLKKLWNKNGTEHEIHRLYMKLGRKPQHSDSNTKLELRPPYVPLESDAFRKTVQRQTNAQQHV